MTPHGHPQHPSPSPGRNPYGELGELGGPDTGPLPWEEPWEESRQREDEGRMPYLRAVRRRRRSRLRGAARLALALAVLTAFAAVADRWAVLYAENRTAEKLQEAMKLHAEPEVHIRGFPFVTQAAAGRLDEVEATVPDVPAGRISLARVHGTVRDVRVVGDVPGSVRGAVLGRTDAEVLIGFDDLDRELGTSQVRFTADGPGTVDARGELPVAGRTVTVRAEAHVRRAGDHGVGTTVDSMRLDVPGLFSYTPGRGEGDGLRLAKPAAERLRRDARAVRALFGVEAVAHRLGYTPEHARLVRGSEERLSEASGAPRFVDDVMDVNLLDAAAGHPEVWKYLGIDPSVLSALRQLEIPELADRMSLSVRLPDTPGDVRLKDVGVEEDGIRARLEGSDIPVGSPGEDGRAQGRQ